MLRRLMVCVTGLMLSAGSVLAEVAAPEEQPAIEIAICLDTSNSMDGLIDAAKQKLWAVVTDLGTAKPTPRLRVALYQYGNDGLKSEGGWVEQLTPLTDDLDTVYDKLFGLRTNGGTEYVPRVVTRAAGDLDWSTDSKTLRMIVVAGNEPATQDAQIKLEDAAKSAVSKGIVINSIFCGNEAEGRNTGWADVARLADGRFAAIDQNGGTVTIASPYDKELSELGAQLNSTYVGYGAAGAAGAANQAKQDANASSLSPAASAQRAAGKAQAQYSNAGWDLVDAVEQKRVDLAKLEGDELPEVMRKLAPEEREAFVQKKAEERQALQAKINDLNGKRQQYVKEEMEKQGLSDKSAFDAALRQALREQAAEKGVKME